MRDEAYKRWIKTWPCLGCGKRWGIDPCHTGPHGTGQKASDLTCIPLCRKCHREFDADPRGFEARHQNCNVAEMVAFFNHVWESKCKRP
jgi:hypothetical protein